MASRQQGRVGRSAVYRRKEFEAWMRDRSLLQNPAKVGTCLSSTQPYSLGCPFYLFITHINAQPRASEFGRLCYPSHTLHTVY